MTVWNVVSEINVNGYYIMDYSDGYYIMDYSVCVTLVTAKHTKLL